MRWKTDRLEVTCVGRNRVGIGVVAVLLAAATVASGDGSRPAQPYHLIYLHGRIVQVEQSARPRHPRFGAYELDEIRATFRDRGFVVHSEIRPPSTLMSEGADRAVAQIRKLLAEGVPADHVTVLGASMGAGIATLASIRLDNPEVRFALLGACFSATVRAFRADEGKGPSGHVLSIREASDETTEPCPAWTDGPGSGESGGSVAVQEKVLSTGLAHGFLYRPLPEWVEPVVAWAHRAEPSAAQQP